jgi:hypothetical protein
MHSTNAKRVPPNILWKIVSKRSTSKSVTITVVFVLLYVFLLNVSMYLSDTTTTTFRPVKNNKWNSLLLLSGGETAENTPHPKEWKTFARACGENDAPVKLQDNWYKSQSQEDKELLTWFSDLCGGTYLEMGGLDGIFLSNSYIFNKGLGWKGVLVEASPTQYPLLAKNRPNEIATVHAGACEKSMDLHWVENPHTHNVEGFLEFAAPSFQKQWWTEEMIQNAKVVKCKPMKQILQETVGSNFYFDFFSLDVEGAEYKVLKSIDFDQVGFGIVLVEADEHNELKNMAVRTLLESNGYTFLRNFHRSYWFVNKDFASIYEELAHVI